MRESSLVFRPYLVCPLYLLALLIPRPDLLASPEVTRQRICEPTCPLDEPSQVVTRTRRRVKKHSPAILKN